MAKKKNNLPGFLKPIRGKRYRRELRAATRAQFRPIQRQVGGEIRASKAQSGRIRDYFKEYGKSLDPIAQRTAQAYGGAQQQIGQQSQASSQYAETLRQRLEGEARADAERRGVSYDPSGAQTNVAAQLARMNASNVLSGVIGAQGASQQAYLRDKQRIGEREKIEQLLREQARRRSFQADKREIAREKGAFRTDFRRQTRDTERDFYLGLLAARDKKAARRFAAQESAKSRRFESREARAEDKRSRRYQERQAKLFGDKKKGGGGGGTKGGGTKGGGGGGQPGSAADRKRASAYLRSGKYKDKKDARDYLINRGVHPAVARWAVRQASKSGGKKKKDSGPQFDKFH